MSADSLAYLYAWTHSIWCVRACTAVARELQSHACERAASTVVGVLRALDAQCAAPRFDSSCGKLALALESHSKKATHRYSGGCRNETCRVACHGIATAIDAVLAHNAGDLDDMHRCLAEAYDQLLLVAPPGFDGDAFLASWVVCDLVNADVEPGPVRDAAVAAVLIRRLDAAISIVRVAQETAV